MLLNTIPAAGGAGSGSYAVMRAGQVSFAARRQARQDIIADRRERSHRHVKATLYRSFRVCSLRTTPTRLRIKALLAKIAAMSVRRMVCALIEQLAQGQFVY